MNSVLFVIETMMWIMQEYPSLISRRADIQVLPCASLRARLTPRRNKELSPGSNTKDQCLEDTLEKWNFSLGTPVNTCPQLSGDTKPKNRPAEKVFSPLHLNVFLKLPLKLSKVFWNTEKITPILSLPFKLTLSPSRFLSLFDSYNQGFLFGARGFGV